MKTQIQVQFRQTTWKQARASKPGCRASTVGIMTHKNHTGDGTVPRRPDGLPRLAPAPLQCSQPITLYADWEAPAGRCRVSSGPDGGRQPGPRDTMKNADAHLPSLTEQTTGSSEAQRTQLGP